MNAVWKVPPTAAMAEMRALGRRSQQAAQVTVRQDGQMPSPVVLKVQFDKTGGAIKPMPNAKMLDENTALVTWPVDVWFNGSRTFDAVLDFGARPITAVTLDPYGRFPDKNPADNDWSRESKK